jgi:hypothetical protein
MRVLFEVFQDVLANILPSGAYSFRHLTTLWFIIVNHKEIIVNLCEQPPLAKRAQILGLLVEANSLRATSRLADCSIHTP